MTSVAALCPGFHHKSGVLSQIIKLKQNLWSSSSVKIKHNCVKWSGTREAITFQRIRGVRYIFTVLHSPTTESLQRK